MNQSVLTGRLTGQQITLSLAYQPALCAVKWGESSEDVPFYDWTYEEQDAFTAPMKKPSKKKLDYIHEQVLRRYAQGVSLRFDGVDKETLTEAYRDKPLPRAMSYPRLVRAHLDPDHVESFGGTVYRQLSRFWESVKGKNPNPSDSKLRRLVPTLVRKIGLLDPHGTDDSATDWYLAAFEVDFWLELLQDLQAKDSERATLDIEKSTKELFEDSGFVPDGEEFIKDTEPRRIESHKLLGLLGSVRESLYGLQKKRCTVSEAAHTIAEKYLLHNTLGELGQPKRLTFEYIRGEWTPTAWVGSLAWARYELYGLYNKRRDVLTCPECNELFPQGHGSDKFCSRQCENTFNQRQRRRNKRNICVQPVCNRVRFYPFLPVSTSLHE
jgi:hypothetical protein